MLKMHATSVDIFSVLLYFLIKNLYKTMIYIDGMEFALALLKSKNNATNLSKSH
jgi:hypothetical protein